MTVELIQEGQKNVAESIGRNRLINVSFDNCSMQVNVPSSIKSSDKEIELSLASFYEGLIEARSSLSIMPSKIKSNGRTRSEREMRDIKLIREKQLNSVRNAINVFRGNLPGVVELIPALDRETNLIKPAGFKIDYSKSNS